MTARPVASFDLLALSVTLAALSGCATCQPPTHEAEEWPADLEVRLVRAAEVEGQEHLHFGEGVDLELGSGQGVAYACREGWIQEGTWAGGAPTGAVTLRLGPALRFQGTLEADGTLTGTVFGQAWEDRMELTRNSLTPAEKEAIRARLARGKMPAPLFVGQLRAVGDGRFVPHRGRWYDVQQEGARVRGWELGERSDAGWEGTVERHRVTQGEKSLDPAEHVAELEWVREHRAGKPHGVWLTWAGGVLVREEPWVDGRLHGVVREYDAAGALSAEIPHHEGRLEGHVWRRRDGVTRSVNFHQGEPASHLELTFPEDSPLRRECLTLDQRSWESREGSLFGWRYVEPREGRPYMELLDAIGRRVERVRTPLPEGFDRWEDLLAGAVELPLANGRRWVGPVKDGKPEGWGRIYDPLINGRRGFEEGFFVAGRPSGFTTWVYPRPDQPQSGFRYLELYERGRPVPEDRHSLLLQTRAGERALQAELRSYDQRLHAKAVQSLRDNPFRHSPTHFDRQRGRVSWSNGVDTEGTPVAPSQLRSGDVVWVSFAIRSQFSGFTVVLAMDGDKAELCGIGSPVSLAPPAQVKRFSELGPYRSRFGERCQVCRGTGNSGEVRYKIQFVERTEKVQFVDQWGRGRGTGTVTGQAMESEPVAQRCLRCSGGHRVGEWGSFR